MRKIFFSIFIRFGIVVWIFSVALYPLYMAVVHRIPGLSEAGLMMKLKCWGPPLIGFFLIAHFLFPMPFLLKGKISGRLFIRCMIGQIGKTFLLALGLLLLWKLFLGKQNAEGCDILLFFPLAFLSGVLHKRGLAGNVLTVLWAALLAWFSIIAVNEIFQCFLPFRKGEIGDLLYNMGGAAIGLLSSAEWFWSVSSAIIF